MSIERPISFTVHIIISPTVDVMKNAMADCIPRSYKSASSPCLTTPLLSMPPDPSSSGLGCQAQDETERGPQPSRFWQVLNYIFGGSPKLNAD